MRITCSCSLIPRLPGSGMQTLKLCRPGNFINYRGNNASANDSLTLDTCSHRYLLVQVNEGILSLTLNLTSDKDQLNGHNRLCYSTPLITQWLTLLSFIFMLVQVKNEGILYLALNLTSDKDLLNSHNQLCYSTPLITQSFHITVIHLMIIWILCH